jgi:tRNA(adenine34) deaminase
VYQFTLARRTRRGARAFGPRQGNRRAPRASNEGAVVEVVGHDVERRERTLGARPSDFDEALPAVDEAFMDLALDEARAAEASDEVPVGAVVVLDGRVIARAHNATRAERDPTAHAEIAAIRAACRAAGAQRIPGAVVYTTVEPCFMCAGALSHARVERVVWAVRDPKFGGCASLGQVLSDPRLNHRVAIREGVRADEARALLQEFFRKKRGHVA